MAIEPVERCPGEGMTYDRTRVFSNPATQAQRGPYSKTAKTRVARLRLLKGWTKVEAAKQARVSLRTYERAEAGDYVTPSTVRSIERALGAAW